MIRWRTGEGFGRRIDGKAPHYEDAAVELGYAPKAKIEIVCHDEEAQAIVQTIQESAHTGRHGDGMIYISPVEDAIRIRTKEANAPSETHGIKGQSNDSEPLGELDDMVNCL